MGYPTKRVDQGKREAYEEHGRKIDCKEEDGESERDHSKGERGGE